MGVSSVGGVRSDVGRGRGLRAAKAIVVGERFRQSVIIELPLLISSLSLSLTSNTNIERTFKAIECLGSSGNCGPGVVGLCNERSGAVAANVVRSFRVSSAGGGR